MLKLELCEKVYGYQMKFLNFQQNPKQVLLHIDGGSNISFIGCVFCGPYQDISVLVTGNPKKIVFTGCKFINANVKLDNSNPETQIEFFQCTFRHCVIDSIQQEIGVAFTCSNGKAYVCLTGCEFILQEECNEKGASDVNMLLVQNGTLFTVGCKFVNQNAETLTSKYIVEEKATLFLKDNRHQPQKKFLGKDNHFMIHSGGRLEARGVYFSSGASIHLYPDSLLDLRDCILDVFQKGMVLKDYPIITVYSSNTSAAEVAIYLENPTLLFPQGPFSDLAGLFLHIFDGSTQGHNNCVFFGGNVYVGFEGLGEELGGLNSGTEQAEIATKYILKFWENHLFGSCSTSSATSVSNNSVWKFCTGKEYDTASPLKFLDGIVMHIEGISEDMASSSGGKPFLDKWKCNLCYPRGGTLNPVNDRKGFSEAVEKIFRGEESSLGKRERDPSDS